MGVVQVAKRIPRIKFPNRHPHPSASGSSSSSHVQAIQNDGDAQQQQYFSWNKVPAGLINTAVGGKASLQPKRTPVTDREIEAIMLGGCF
ncbi:uncharacterized protein LOC124910288 [Impatiens glandulifera]|uniref:uncharacterized protein LOC124910288 n=1 Tax=Impatiens glandulifera TaxID=253017 RepID=UPI001FB084B3|nr:uncharacterized protein LOC124910288 [Impatiens glandulifera]